MDNNIHLNADAAPREPYRFQHILSLAGADAARSAIAQCPAYTPTPLIALPHLAATLGVSEVRYKDEAHRLGLESFKALGGAYAVARLLADQAAAALGRPVELADLVSGKHRTLTAGLTVACASDGNHGRSVAAGARIFGCRAVIFLHEGVSPGREAAILQQGGQVIRTAGDYDASVREAQAAADRQGWVLVADTAGAKAGSHTATIMQGYSVLVAEVLDQLGRQAPPTHVILQGGVGGLAGAVVAHLWEALGAERRPVFIVVEPSRADCLFQSARAGRPTPASGDLKTVMAGLSCGEVSALAWPILHAGVQVFLTVDDDAAIAAMRDLALGRGGDASIVAGESAAAGLAGLRALAVADAETRAAARLDAGSRILLIGTEGATDPAIYRELLAPDIASAPP